MASQPPAPLTPADLEEIKQRLKDLDAADAVIDQAIRGGIDMTEQRSRSRELRERLNKIRQSFFPGR